MRAVGSEHIKKHLMYNKGTGLGLSLGYDIVTKVHGGEIKLESEEGKYTEFIINLPKQ